MKRIWVLALAASMVASTAVPTLAEPDLQIPVQMTLNVRVPAKYWLKFALFDRDGRDSLDPGAEVWYEHMDTLQPKLVVRSKKYRHLLGSIASPVGELDPADFGQQLWAQAFYWNGITWVPCSVREKLLIQPYSIFSVSAGGAGAIAPDTVNSANIVNNSVAGADIQDGTITAGDIAAGAVTGAQILNGTISGIDVAAGTLTGSHIADASITVADVDTSTVQARVTGSCPAGQAIRAINANGTVACITGLLVGQSIGNADAPAASGFLTVLDNYTPSMNVKAFVFARCSVDGTAAGQEYDMRAAIRNEATASVAFGTAWYLPSDTAAANMPVWNTVYDSFDLVSGTTYDIGIIVGTLPPNGANWGGCSVMVQFFSR